MGDPVFEKKLEKLRNAMVFQKTDTTPNIASATGWQIYDSPYSTKEAYYDFKKLKDAIIGFANRYDFDAYEWNGATYCFPFTDALGGGAYQMDEKTGSLTVVDHNYIFPEEYKEYADDPAAFMRKAFARKYPNLTTPMFEKALTSFFTFGQYAAGADAMFKDEAHSPLMSPMSSIVMSPLEILNSSMRGIKDLALDIRRNKAELKYFLDANWEKVQHPGLKRNLQADRSDYVCDFYSAFLAHAFLSTKQFEELYWPYFKEALDEIFAAGKTIFIFSESEITRFYEFFQDVPKGRMILQVEQDDIRDLRRKLPNICLAGGFPIEMLGHGTPEECIDIAKSLIDDMGEGYILSASKVLAYPNDAKRENLLALNNFVREYRP